MGYVGLNEYDFAKTSKTFQSHVSQLSSERENLIVRIFEEGKAGSWKGQAGLYQGDHFVELTRFIVTGDFDQLSASTQRIISCCTDFIDQGCYDKLSIGVHNRYADVDNKQQVAKLLVLLVSEKGFDDIAIVQTEDIALEKSCFFNLLNVFSNGSQYRGSLDEALNRGSQNTIVEELLKLKLDEHIFIMRSMLHSMHMLGSFSSSCSRASDFQYCLQVFRKNLENLIALSRAGVNFDALSHVEGPKQIKGVLQCLSMCQYIGRLDDTSEVVDNIIQLLSKVGGYSDLLNLEHLFSPEAYHLIPQLLECDPGLVEGLLKVDFTMNQHDYAKCVGAILRHQEVILAYRPSADAGVEEPSKIIETLLERLGIGSMSSSIGGLFPTVLKMVLQPSEKDALDCLYCGKSNIEPFNDVGDIHYVLSQFTTNEARLNAFEKLKVVNDAFENACEERMGEVLEQLSEGEENKALESIIREISLSLCDSWCQYKQDHFDTIDVSQPDAFVGAFSEEPIAKQCFIAFNDALQTCRGAEGLAR